MQDVHISMNDGTHLQGLGRPYLSGSWPGPKNWHVLRAAFTVHPGWAGHTRHLQHRARFVVSRRQHPCISHPRE
jgi:hypothetical protein